MSKWNNNWILNNKQLVSFSFQWILKITREFLNGNFLFLACILLAGYSWFLGLFSFHMAIKSTVLALLSTHY